MSVPQARNLRSSHLLNIVFYFGITTPVQILITSKSYICMLLIQIWRSLFLTEYLKYFNSQPKRNELVHSHQLDTRNSIYVIDNVGSWVNVSHLVLNHMHRYRKLAKVLFSGRLAAAGCLPGFRLVSRALRTKSLFL